MRTLHGNVGENDADVLDFHDVREGRSAGAVVSSERSAFVSGAPGVSLIRDLTATV